MSLNPLQIFTPPVLPKTSRGEDDKWSFIYSAYDLKLMVTSMGCHCNCACVQVVLSTSLQRMCISAQWNRLLVHPIK